MLSIGYTGIYYIIKYSPTSYIGLPNVLRSMEYLVASSKALVANPTAPAATYVQYIVLSDDN